MLTNALKANYSYTLYENVKVYHSIPLVQILPDHLANPTNNI